MGIGSPTGRREAMIVVCRRCGSWYDMDFTESFDCHDGPDDWWVDILDVPDDGIYYWIAPGVNVYPY